MDISQENQHYDRQWELVDEFYNTNEPEGFGENITSDEAEALRTYYFVSPSERDVYQYRAQLSEENPILVRKAKAAARKIAKISGLTEMEIEAIFL